MVEYDMYQQDAPAERGRVLIPVPLGNAPPVAAASPGCICPAGANLTCQALLCPRRPVRWEVRAP